MHRGTTKQPLIALQLPKYRADDEPDIAPIVTSFVVSPTTYDGGLTISREMITIHLYKARWSEATHPLCRWSANTVVPHRDCFTKCHRQEASSLTRRD